MSSNFTFAKDSRYTGSWFFASYWTKSNPWTATATNISSKSQSLSGVLFSFVSGNSGGQSFNVGGGSYSRANGSGCKMRCKAICQGKSTLSRSVTVPSSKQSNIQGDLSDNDNCWFTPRPGLSYTFYFDDPIEVPPGKQVSLGFYVTEWTGGVTSGDPVLQVSKYDDISEPTSFQVTFNLDGGTRVSGGQLVQTVPNGGDATPPTCKKSGYQFSGWDRSYKNITQTSTITAIWKALPVWRYDGSKWVHDRTIKQFNGSKWVESNLHTMSNNKWIEG